MNRRKLLQSTVGLTALGLTTSTVSARDEGELPNDNVSVSTVFPVSAWEPYEVTVGDWIEHRYGWVELCDTSEKNRQRAIEFFDSFDLVVKIDGEQVENPEQYYEAPVKSGVSEETGETKWAKYFSYYTPPKSPGEHTFRFEQHFTSDFLRNDAGPPGDFCSENTTIEAGEVIVYNASYDVVRKSKGKN